jgi:hydrogenase maturation protein HypF
MQTFSLKIKTDKKILALGAELDSAFGYYYKGKVTLSDNIANTANNPILLEKKINTLCRDALQCVSSTPDYILTDLNPEYNTFKVGANLAKKWQIPHIKIQHHHAHIFSAIFEHYLLEQTPDIPNQLIGIACDGTGYGTDKTIWGGEIFTVGAYCHTPSITRIGHLEQQKLLGGQLAIEEPARMLISILAKFLNQEDLYKTVKTFYSQNDYNLLYSQLQQNFNCQKTTSCARILDAACALLFKCNERKFKHQAAKILEKNSSKPYDDIKPEIKNKNNIFILKTTPLFEYLIKNLNKDKKRLAATAHYYIANGLLEITEKFNPAAAGQNSIPPIIFSGGMANNKIFRKYFEEKNFLLNKKTESGDPGISLGQIAYFLTSPPDKGGLGGLMTDVQYIPPPAEGVGGGFLKK